MSTDLRGAASATTPTGDRASRLIRRRQRKRGVAKVSVALLAGAIVLVFSMSSALSGHHGPSRVQSLSTPGRSPLQPSRRDAPSKVSAAATGAAALSGPSITATPIRNAAAVHVPATSATSLAAPAAFDGHACSLVAADALRRLLGPQVTAASTTDGSNGCEYRAAGHIIASVAIDRGSTGGPATVVDLHQLVDGMSGQHTTIPKLGDAATLVGNQQSAVLFVVAKGWTMQVVADPNTEQQLAQAAITRL
jgi:hypothetical protein